MEIYNIPKDKDELEEAYKTLGEECKTLRRGREEEVATPIGKKKFKTDKVLCPCGVVSILYQSDEKGEIVAIGSEKCGI